jgi:hypothetical protein
MAKKKLSSILEIGLHNDKEAVMKLRQVHNIKDCRFTCVSCNRIIQRGPVLPIFNDLHVQGNVWADMDGKPYESYYCDECKAKLAKNGTETTLYAVNASLLALSLGPFKTYDEAYNVALDYYSHNMEDRKELAKKCVIEIKEITIK